jgi:hypothetical protein
MTDGKKTQRRSGSRWIVGILAALISTVLFSPPATVIAAKNLVPMGTGASGGYYFVLGAAISKVLNQYGRDLNVIPQSVQGSAESTKLVNSGELRLGLAVVDALHFAVRGEREFDRRYTDVRLVVPLPYVTMAGVMLKDSPIKNIGDLKGRSVAANSKTTEAVNVALLNEYGLGPDDYKRRILNYTEQASALKDGNLDVAVMPAWPRSATILELANSRPIRFLIIDQEHLKAFDAKYPYWTAVAVPAGTYPGQDREILAPGLFGYVITNKSADEQLVYEITKAILEHAEEIGKIHPSGKDMTLDLVKLYVQKKVMPTAFHPGAVRYLTEHGVRPN